MASARSPRVDRSPRPCPSAAWSGIHIRHRDAPFAASAKTSRWSLRRPAPLPTFTRRSLPRNPRALQFQSQPASSPARARQSPAAAPTPINSLPRSTAQLNPAEIGSRLSPNSCPYNGIAASSRNVSRTPSPAGLIGASGLDISPDKRFHHHSAPSRRTQSISTPSSPVYPLRKSVNRLIMYVPVFKAVSLDRLEHRYPALRRSIPPPPAPAPPPSPSIASDRQSLHQTPVDPRTSFRCLTIFSRLEALQTISQCSACLADDHIIQHPARRIANQAIPALPNPLLRNIPRQHPIQKPNSITAR